MPIFDTRPVAIIGAGPSGLAAARNLDRQGVAWVGFDLAGDVGGLWNIDSPRSTVYASAHLISSARTTEFAEFPMPADTHDYPDQGRMSGCRPSCSSTPIPTTRRPRPRG